MRSRFCAAHNSSGKIGQLLYDCCVPVGAAIWIERCDTLAAAPQAARLTKPRKLFCGPPFALLTIMPPVPRYCRPSAYELFQSQMASLEQTDSLCRAAVAV